MDMGTSRRALLLTGQRIKNLTSQDHTSMTILHMAAPGVGARGWADEHDVEAA
jgi:hypothetical protein